MKYLHDRETKYYIKNTSSIIYMNIYYIYELIILLNSSYILHKNLNKIIQEPD